MPWPRERTGKGRVHGGWSRCAAWAVGIAASLPRVISFASGSSRGHPWRSSSSVCAVANAAAAVSWHNERLL